MESFEKIVPIIFLIIWAIIAVAAKKRKKQQARGPADAKKPKPARSVPFLGNLQNTLESMFAQLENPPQEELPTKLKSQETSDSEELFEEDYSREETDSEVLIPEDTPHAKKTPTPESPYSTKRKSTSATSPSIRKLQNAVIWSEILAKPVALRDE